ncbi:hypothetical protein QE152_g10047 [Popillia japonica]|uniref:Uncharacterized protein n=1 Tax=Popillia japonica TaxID=7064 RepID=A0AAW1LSI6_POPJA
MPAGSPITVVIPSTTGLNAGWISNHGGDSESVRRPGRSIIRGALTPSVKRLQSAGTGSSGGCRSAGTGSSGGCRLCLSSRRESCTEASSVCRVPGQGVAAAVGSAYRRDANR